MRKHLIILGVVLLLCSVAVFAADLKINDIKVYVSDVRNNDVDVNGGTIDDVQPLDTVEFRVYVENTNTNSSLTDIVVNGIIQNINSGRDVSKTLSAFTLRYGESDMKVLTFTIPQYAEEDTYQVDIKVRAINVNGEDEYYNVSYDMNVYTTKNLPFNMQDSFSNLTNTCTMFFSQTSYIKDKIDVALGSYEQCKNNQSNLIIQVNSLNTQVQALTDQNNKNGANLQTANAELVRCQSDLSNLNNLYNQTVARDGTDLKNCQNGSQTQMMIFIIGICVAVGLYYYSKKGGRIMPKSFGGLSGDSKPSGIQMMERSGGRGG